MSIFPILPGTSSSGANLDNIQISDVSGLQSALESTLKTAQRSVANGVAPLDANGKVPAVNLPDSVTSGLVWQGVWNANTNTPAIPAASSSNGYFYKVNVAGTQNLNGSGDVNYAIGDWLISNGTSWEQIGATDSVLSVAGKTGAVSLTLDDIVGLGTALNSKSAIGHTHPETDITNLATDLASKASVTHNHTINDVDTLATALSGKAAVSHTHIIANTTGLQDALDAKAESSLIGVASGIAPLDSSGKLPIAVIPASLIGGLVWKGTWDVNAGSPVIPAAATTNNGWFYKVSVAGTSSVTGSSVTYNVGDWLISNGTAWQRVENSSATMTGATSSTAGTGGIVPVPAAGMQDAHLAGDGQWDPILRRSIVSLTNFTVGATLSAASTVDIAEVIAIPQTTTGITVALPTPTNNLRVRKIIFINTGSVPFSLNTGHTVEPGKWVELYWALALQAWKTYVGDTKSYKASNNYQAYDRCVIGNITAYANADIPATAFVWGTSGQTWSPLLPLIYTWRGTYNSNTAYAANDIFCWGSSLTAQFYLVKTGFTSSASGVAVDMAKGGIAVGNVSQLPFGLSSDRSFVGATNTKDGDLGAVPAPTATSQDATLKGNGEWDKTGRGVYLNLSNYTANTTLSAASTVDVAEYLIIPQTTSNITLTLPPPTVISVTRKLHIVNTGTASITVAGTAVPSNKVGSYTWPANGSSWIAQSGGDATAVDSHTLSYLAMDSGTTPQTITNTTTNFTFSNQIMNSGSNISYSAGVFSLKGGYKYRLSFAHTFINGTAGGYFYYGFYDVNNSVFIGNQGGGDTVTSTSNTIPCSPIVHELDLTAFQPTTIKQIAVRSSAISGSTSLGVASKGTPWIRIEELPLNSSVPAGSMVATPLSFYSGQATSTQAPSTTTPILFHSTVLSQGSNITYNAGIFTVEAGLKIELEGHCGSTTSTNVSNAINYGWMQSTDGGTNWTKVGNIVVIASTGANWQDASSNQGMATFCTTTSVQTKFKLQTNSFSNISLLGGGQGANPSYPAATIKEIPSYNVVAANQLSVVDLAFGSAVATPYPGGTTGTGYSIAAATATTVTCAATVKSATNIVGSAGTLQFTIQRAGNYRIKAGSTVTNTSGACWSSTIIGVNGTTTAQSPSSWVSVASAGCPSEVETIVPLAIGDVVTCRAYSQYAGYIQGGYLTVEQLPQTAFYSMAETDVPVDPLEYGYYRWSANQSITLSVQDVSPDVTISGTIPNSGGVFSLVAGKTYEIELGLYATWSGAGVTGIAWVDATTNTQLSGSPVFSINAISGGNNSGDPGYKFIYTPAANQTIKLRTTDSTQNCLILATRSWVSIKQMPFGTVSLINSASTTVQEWQSGTVGIGVISGTAPTQATAAVKTARYRVIGKTLYLDYNYSADNNTGATAGSGVYVLDISSILAVTGRTIDLNTAPIDTNASGGVIYPRTCPVGTGLITLYDGSVNNGGVLTAHVASTTTIAVCGTASVSGNTTSGWVSNVFYSMSLNKRSVSLKMEIPLS